MSALADRRLLLRAGLVSAISGVAAGTAASPAEAQVTRLRERDVVRWTRAYLEAWQAKDADAAVGLFTADAVYEAVPGVPEQTFHGRDAIHRYWTDITAPQSQMSWRHGTPIITGNRAAVELWVTLQVPSGEGGALQWITLIESNVLYFASASLCCRNVEYWNLQNGRLEPPQGWGNP